MVYFIRGPPLIIKKLVIGGIKCTKYMIMIETVLKE